MILYLDSSALVKLYIKEFGSAQILTLIESADSVGTVLITRVEVSATFAKVVRMGLLARERAQQNLDRFREHWNDFERLEMNESLVDRADSFAWQYHLRGYDAVQLAAAVVWQQALNEPVTFATFDQKLWTAARQAGLLAFPSDLVTER